MVKFVFKFIAKFIQTQFLLRSVTLILADLFSLVFLQRKKKNALNLVFMSEH